MPDTTSMRTRRVTETKMDRMSRLIRETLRPQAEREIRRSYDDAAAEEANNA